MDHLLLCPALTCEHLQLKEEMKAKLTKWNIPFASIPFKSYEVETRIGWRLAALRILPSITKLRLDILTKMYWKTHSHKQFISTQNFINDLKFAVKTRYSRSCTQLRQDLIAVD